RRGKVLPVGGIKEKVLAARRAGIETVILPRRNEKDLEDVPAGVRDTLRFHFVESMDETLALALSPQAVDRGARGASGWPARRHPVPDRIVRSLMPELRKDPLLGRWVIIGTERVRRPADFRVPRSPRRGGPCALCAGHERETPPEVLVYRDKPADDSWRVRVVPSKFPVLRVEGDLERRGHGLYDLMNGIGAHEVVIESPRHDDALARMPVAGVDDVVRAWRDRIVDLKRDQRFRAIMVFKGHAAGDGAALEHPHSQLLATPIPPQGLNDELHHARAYHDYRERCLFCDIAHQEAE